jgi:hypothetical protein
VTTREKNVPTANELASLITRNIRDITTTITMNIDYDKPYTVLAAYAGAYSVTSYFEYKLTELGISPQAIQKAKEGAERYVIDVISSDLGGFSIDKGEA